MCKYLTWLLRHLVTCIMLKVLIKGIQIPLSHLYDLYGS